MARFTRKQKVLIFLFVLVASFGLVGAVLLHPVGPHLRAMSLLMRFSGAKPGILAASFAQQPFKETNDAVQTAHGVVQYRLYVPQNIVHPGAVVLVHGVHHLGMEDPRLWSLARALASAGVEVMTPEVQDLADYRITQRSIDVIGDSAVALTRQVGRKVGVLGLSFAGGLALMAADRPEYSQEISFVLAIGAHDDMGRVARFFAANMTTRPDGSEVPLQAHEYGVLVLAYSHLEDFFSPSDVPAAREALRRWLWERPDAMEPAAQLSPEGKSKLEQLLHHRELLRSALLKEISSHQAEMDAVSPHGHLEKFHTPVYLLHGEGDTVIPASETAWLARDVPHDLLRATLISPALVHVDMEESVTLQQKWALVDFLAQILEAAEKSPSTATGRK